MVAPTMHTLAALYLRLLLSHHLCIRLVDQVIYMWHQQLRILRTPFLVTVTDRLADTTHLSRVCRIHVRLVNACIKMQSAMNPVAHVFEWVDGDDDVTHVCVNDLLLETVLQQIEDCVLGQLLWEKKRPFWSER